MIGIDLVHLENRWLPEIRHVTRNVESAITRNVAAAMHVSTKTEVTGVCVLSIPLNFIWIERLSKIVLRFEQVETGAQRTRISMLVVILRSRYDSRSHRRIGPIQFSDVARLKVEALQKFESTTQRRDAKVGKRHSRSAWTSRYATTFSVISTIRIRRRKVAGGNL